MELKNMWAIELGDKWCDGHGIHKMVICKSNKTEVEIANILLNSMEKYGIPLWNMCENYEDSSISEEIKNKLLNIGFDITKSDFYPYDEDDEDSEWYANVDGFVDIILFLIRKYDTTAIVELTEIPCINYIGININGRRREVGSLGYGLFSL